MDFMDEPMEVDLSNSSGYICSVNSSVRHIDAMDISYNDSNYSSLDINKSIKQEPIDTNDDVIENIIEDENSDPPPVVIKRYSLQRKYHKSLSNTSLSILITIASLVTVLIYQIAKFECSKELDLQFLKKSLTKNVIGQPQAIEHIIETLEDKSSSKVLLLYGGTGVGKTLTISLILENLHQYANIYHHTMPTFAETFSTDLMLGLSFCPNSIIVVDDLHGIEMQVKNHIRKVIEKSENLNKNITIILVFNCDTINNHYVKKCDYSFTTDLQKAFEEIKALKRLIKFNSLKEEHLRKCIEKELGDKVLIQEEFENILKNFNVSVDGCKGVYTKIKLLNIN